MGDLTELQREILLFEATWRPGRLLRRDAIKERFGISPNTYLKLLDEAIEVPAAQRIAPTAVESRRRSRARRREAWQVSEQRYPTVDTPVDTEADTPAEEAS